MRILSSCSMCCMNSSFSDFGIWSIIQMKSTIMFCISSGICSNSSAKARSSCCCSGDIFAIASRASSCFSSEMICGVCFFFAINYKIGCVTSGGFLWNDSSVSAIDERQYSIFGDSIVGIETTIRCTCRTGTGPRLFESLLLAVEALKVSAPFCEMGDGFIHGCRQQELLCYYARVIYR